MTTSTLQGYIISMPGLWALFARKIMLVCYCWPNGCPKLSASSWLGRATLLTAMGNAHMGYLRGLPFAICIVKQSLHIDLYPSGFLAHGRKGRGTHIEIHTEPGGLTIAWLHNLMVASRGLSCLTRSVSLHWNQDELAYSEDYTNCLCCRLFCPQGRASQAADWM